MTMSEIDSFPLTVQQGKYLLIIFECVPTVLEKTTLEQILTEIGRIKNLSNFLVTVTCKEATDRLMAHAHSQKVSCVTFKQFFLCFLRVIARADICTVTKCKVVYLSSGTLNNLVTGG